MIVAAVITCPNCHHRHAETMPSDACVWFYQCPSCQKILKPKAGDCCVFCSYGSAPCPSRQPETGSPNCRNSGV